MPIAVKQIQNVTTATLLPNNANMNAVKSESESESKPQQNKAVVKRSASGNTNLFWNDIYDDEYGVEDPLGENLIVSIWCTLLNIPIRLLQ